MNSALIEIGDPDINEERVIQQLQFTFSKQFIKKIKKRLKNFHINNIAHALTLPPDDSYSIKLYNCLKKILQYWKQDYNFHKQEEVFNQFPHFYIIIDDLKIHYIHVKPINPDKKPVYPLLMLHGWPSSVLEFYNVIPHLINATEVNDFIFEVIIPSLPGFGGSDCPSNENLNCDFIAGLLVKLMKVLGHEQFYVHCDDWCIFVVYAMSMKYSANLLAIHYAPCRLNKFTHDNLLHHNITLHYYISKRLKNIYLDNNRELQLKKEGRNSPTSFCAHTIGISAIDSPVVLLAYLFDQFIKDLNFYYADIESNDSEELIPTCQFLDNVMMYWTTNSIIKTLKAYSGYSTFDNFDKVKACNSCVRFNNFVGVSFFFSESDFFTTDIYPKSIQSTENIPVSRYYHRNSYRIPVIQSPMIVALHIFDHFKQFLARNVPE